MSGYRMILVTKYGEIDIPVLPPKFSVSSAGKNERVTVLEVGEVLLLRKKGLRCVSWESFFPKNAAPYVVSSVSEEMSSPADTVRAIQKLRDEKTPVRFLITGTELDCNVRMGIESFEYEERSGENGDIYYSIKLYEYKDISPKKINLSADGKSGTEEETNRAGDSSKPKSYVVKSGDTLWAIAKRIYGDGGRYTEIVKANPSITNPNLIYAGEELVIPW